MASMTMEEMTARIVQLEVDNGITKTELIDILFKLKHKKWQWRTQWRENLRVSRSSWTI